MMRKAVFLCIGDEILSGKIKDTNGFTVATALHAHGVRLARQETLPDETDTIVERIQYWQGRCDYLLTSGGVGPTHDDITYESVAKALGREVEPREEILERMRVYYAERNLELNSARRKMATVPVGARLSFQEDRWIPLVQVENITILPGIPALFTKLLAEAVEGMESARLYREMVYTKRGEGDIAEILSAAQQRTPNVAIGSYPKYGKEDYKVMITFDGNDESAVRALSEQVMADIGGFRGPAE